MSESPSNTAEASDKNEEQGAQALPEEAKDVQEKGTEAQKVDEGILGERGSDASAGTEAGSENPGEAEQELPPETGKPEEADGSDLVEDDEKKSDNSDAELSQPELVADDDVIDPGKPEDPGSVAETGTSDQAEQEEVSSTDADNEAEETSDTLHEEP